MRRRGINDAKCEMEEYGTTYLVVALIDAARGRGAKLAEICGTGGTRAEAIQADLD